MKEVLLCEYDSWVDAAPDVALLICAAGFEERALTFLRDDRLISRVSDVVTVCFSDGPAGNDRSKAEIDRIFSDKSKTTIPFPVLDPQMFSRNADR